MLTIKLVCGFWILFTAVWMITQDIRVERLERRMKDAESKRNAAP